MGISESQLETWSHQGSVTQSAATYQTIRSALNASSAPYSSQQFTIFLQGSYGNDTNIFADSDVDVVMRLDSVFYTDLSKLTESELSHYNSMKSKASYGLNQFREDIITQLGREFGANSVVPGKKAIFVKGSGSRRDADVLPCAEFRRYRRFRGWADQEYVEGICFFMPDGTRIENFPKQHSENCTKKHQGTNQWFKTTVRTLKNLRNKLINDGKLKAGVAPSYFIEGLLYNVPPGRFGHTHAQNFDDVLNWIEQADRSQFVCANEQYYLINPSSPVTWRAEDCDAFLRAVRMFRNS